MGMRTAFAAGFGHGAGGGRLRRDVVLLSHPVPFALAAAFGAHGEGGVLHGQKFLKLFSAFFAAK